jgi:Domain of unknown function (DUF4872)/Butirosin biosynthesis protein H, N-terminal
MTKQNSLKRLVRARMADTGQSYTTARRIVLGQLDGERFGGVVADGFLHLPGVHPECTALRVLLANSGVVAPHTGEPPSEALVFGIAGGAGAGAMAFRYEREDVTTFYVTGWNPFQSSAQAACERLGIRPAVSETGGARAAATQLGDLLAEGVPAMAWVDLAELGYAALPPLYSGGSYHTVVVYRYDSDGGTALLGDRAARPIEVPAERLAAARARIRKQRNRLLSLGSAELVVDLRGAVIAGLRAAADGPASPPTSAMTLEGVRAWAQRVHGTAAKDGWPRMFPPGRHLWGALRAVYEYVEHWGSGGGLMRPLHAAFLREAAVLVGDGRLDGLAGRYDALGDAWRGLASAALPGGVPLLAETRALLDRRDAAFAAEGAGATGELRAIWARLDALAEQADAGFPLDAAAIDELLAGLQARLVALYADEVAARDELRAILG